MNLKTLRMVLLVALALVVGTLWSRWQLEFDMPKTTPTPVVNGSAPNLPANAQTATDNLQSVASVASSNSSQEKIIYVKSNVLDVGISLNGGNIVSAALFQYPAQLNSPKPVVLLNNDPASLYVAQSGLLSSSLPSNIVFSAASSQYKIDQQHQTVALTYKANNGITLIKQYKFSPNSYAIDVSYQIINNSHNDWQGRFYGQLQRVPPTAADRHIIGTTYTGSAISTPDNHYQKLSFKDLAETTLNVSSIGGWVAMVQHYFISAWVPQESQTSQFYSQTYNDSSYAVGLAGPTLTVAANSQATTGATLYIGPAVANQLEAVAPYLNLTVDYGWLWFISQLLFWLLSHIYAFVGNWGWAIVILTIIIKIVFYPLSAKSYRSMAKMRQLQPKMAQLKERFGDDRQKLSRAVMEMYRDEKVNPMGGCLPMVIQIPVFIALYWVLMESVELRQAPFMLWIHDLAVHDPYYILPVLMGFSMFIQQRLNPPSPDPTQAKIMMFLPVIFTVMFLGFPAGLVLYWLVNNMVTILQQWWVMRKLK